LPVLLMGRALAKSKVEDEGDTADLAATGT
jgi:hypothetical protein